jgi:hypothetical protein
MVIMRELTYRVIVACLAGAILCSSVNGQTNAAATEPNDSPGPVQPSSSPSSKYPPGHKHLSPVDANDIGLFIVIGAALFIAAGAGVGGGKTYWLESMQS